MSRTIYLFGEVDDDMAHETVQALHQLAEKPEEPVTIWLSTPGGSVTAGYAIYDSMKLCPCEITVIGTGSVASMGVWILQAGSRRLLTANTQLLVHPGSWESHGPVDVANLLDLADELRDSHEHGVRLLIERGVEEAVARELCGKESRLTPQQAIDVGLADGILQKADAPKAKAPKRSRK